MWPSKDRGDLTPVGKPILVVVVVVYIGQKVQQLEAFVRNMRIFGIAHEMCIRDTSTRVRDTRVYESTISSTRACVRVRQFVVNALHTCSVTKYDNLRTLRA